MALNDFVQLEPWTKKLSKCLIYCAGHVSGFKKIILNELSDTAKTLYAQPKGKYKFLS